MITLFNYERYLTRRKGKWNKSSVRAILTNYDYTGNLILQKTYKENYITKRTKLNNGEHPKYYVEDFHEAIMSLEKFKTAQEELERRDNLINEKLN